MTDCDLLHMTRANEQIFTEATNVVANVLLDEGEKHNLCLDCFIAHFITYFTASVVDVDPSRAHKILEALMKAASIIVNAPVALAINCSKEEVEAILEKSLGQTPSKGETLQ